MEKTCVILKPDAVERGLIGLITGRLEAKGYNIMRMDMRSLDEDILKEHYAHLVNKPFFPEITSYMMRGPVVVMEVEGTNAVAGVRVLVGATDPLEAAPGSIRADWAESKSENLIHASDSIENAEIELSRFFR